MDEFDPERDFTREELWHNEALPSHPASNHPTPKAARLARILFHLTSAPYHWTIPPYDSEYAGCLRVLFYFAYTRKLRVCSPLKSSTTKPPVSGVFEPSSGCAVTRAPLLARHSRRATSPRRASRPSRTRRATASARTLRIWRCAPYSRTCAPPPPPPASVPPPPPPPPPSRAPARPSAIAGVPPVPPHPRTSTSTQHQHQHQHPRLRPPPSHPRVGMHRDADSGDSPSRWTSPRARTTCTPAVRARPAAARAIKAALRPHSGRLTHAPLRGRARGPAARFLVPGSCASGLQRGAAPSHRSGTSAVAWGAGAGARVVPACLPDYPPRLLACMPACLFLPARPPRPQG